MTTGSLWTPSPRPSGLHPQYFTVIFKKQFHQTFIEFLTHYRIDRSLTALINSDENILAIAVANGFGNHKTYSAAFKKLLGMSPQRYRQRTPRHQSLSDTDSEALQGMFQYFQQFWNQPQQTESGSSQLQRHQTVSFDLSRPQPGEFYNDRPFFVDAGRASSCLRVEIQELIRMAKADLGFHYLRIRDIFPMTSLSIMKKSTSCLSSTGNTSTSSLIFSGPLLSNRFLKSASCRASSHPKSNMPAGISSPMSASQVDREWMMHC